MANDNNGSVRQASHFRKIQAAKQRCEESGHITEDRTIEWALLEIAEQLGHLRILMEEKADMNLARRRD